MYPTGELTKLLREFFFSNYLEYDDLVYVILSTPKSTKTGIVMEFVRTHTIQPGVVPAKFERQKIPLANPFTYIEDDLTIFSQIIDLYHYQIHFHIFDAGSDVIVRPHSRVEILTLHYMLQGNIDCILRHGAEANLRQGEYNMFVVPGHRHHAVLKKGIYECFHINIKDEAQGYLGEEMLMFDFFHKNLRRFGGIINLKPYQMSEDENMIIKQILGCKAIGEEGADMMETWASELVYAFARNYTSELNAIFQREKISSEQLANIYSMKAHYSQNLSNSHDVIKVAELYMMKPQEVEKAFEDIFGNTFTSYFNNQRLSKAFALLGNQCMEPDTIAIILGYQSSIELQKRFEDFYGRTMSEVKRLLSK